MVPVPADPFALPYTEKSDPLRGPIFIPLDTEKLMENRSHLFEGTFFLKYICRKLLTVNINFQLFPKNRGSSDCFCCRIT
jgi:DEPDC5 protein C-terminal region